MKCGCGSAVYWTQSTQTDRRHTWNTGQCRMERRPTGLLVMSTVHINTEPAGRAGRVGGRATVKSPGSPCLQTVRSPPPATHRRKTKNLLGGDFFFLLLLFYLFCFFFRVGGRADGFSVFTFPVISRQTHFGLNVSKSLFVKAPNAVG